MEGRELGSTHERFGAGHCPTEEVELEQVARLRVPVDSDVGTDWARRIGVVLHR